MDIPPNEKFSLNLNNFIKNEKIIFRNVNKYINKDLKLLFWRRANGKRNIS